MIDYKKHRAERKQARIQLEDTITAQKIIQELVATIQGQLHQQVAEVVTHCLQSVFPDPYTFKILFEKKRGKTEARLVFERDGLVIDPLDAAGGGVIDVAAFALRLACILVSQPPLRKVVILDEPWRHVALGIRPLIAQLLESLAESTGVQFILTTHQEEFELGTVVRIG